MVEKHPQQSIFRPAEGDNRPAVVQQMAGGGIEQPVAKRDQPARLGDLQVGRQRPGAASNGLDARQQFAGHKGLHQIVVRPHLEAEDPVAVVGAGSEHQHRNVLLRVSAQLATER